MGAVDEVLVLEERLRMADAGPEPDTTGIFQELFVADPLMVGAGGIFPFEAVLAGHRPPKRHFFSDVKVSERTVRDLGDTVLVTCRTDYHAQGRVFGLRALRVWKRVGASWKVAAVALLELPKDEE